METLNGLPCLNGKGMGEVWLFECGVGLRFKRGDSSSTLGKILKGGCNK